MKIYYWSPFTSKVATIKAVINSAYGLRKFYKHETLIINSFGEWDNYKKKIKKCKIGLVNSSIKVNFKNYSGYIKSRIAYTVIFIKSFFYLNQILKTHKPDYLVIHLITSLPIILFLIFNYRTKLILRVSGFPKLNLFRKLLWKIGEKNFLFITTPTTETYKNLCKKNIFSERKIHYLPDPILLNEKNKKKTKNIYGKYILNIGRLSNQKNQKLLIHAFSKISSKYSNIKLIILGEGEKYKELKNLVNSLNLKKRILFLGHINDPLNLIKNSYCMVVSSLWEDPGFVMIEGAHYKKPVLCSDCPNGPREFFNNGKNGFLFKNNNIQSLVDCFEKFKNTKKKNLKVKLLNSYKNSYKYSYKHHSKLFNNLINNS